MTNKMAYAGYVFCSRSKTFKTPGEMPVFSLPKDLAGALDLVPLVELRERTEREAGIPQDAIDRIDCLAGLRSDVTQLSGELAIIAMPALNRWNEF